MYKDLDIQIEDTLKAYLASGVVSQVDYQKLYLCSTLTHFTTYPKNDTGNPQLDTVNDSVSSQNNSINEFKGGLKRIYRAEYQTSF